MKARFGPFVLDRERYELRRDDEPVAAEPQVLEVLSFLIENRDRVVSKDDLLEAVWQGRFVSDSAVSRAIKETRRLLGDSAADSRWIKTVYGRGFRFVGRLRDTPTRLDDDQTPSDPTPHPSRWLPDPAPAPVPLTPLLGRERDLDKAEKLLEGTRLLTLTGAAGTGKSRLALALASRVGERFADGVAYVPLAEVTGSGQLVGAIARAIGASDAAGLSPAETLRLHLRSSSMLLLLDNFEQLLDQAPVLADLLQVCPGLVALVTSRFVLKVPGEQELTVPPLSLPLRRAPEEELLQAPAVALFLERARAGSPHFDPRGEDLSYVAEICRRLDGLPLAIELAAPWIKMFRPQALWERLAVRLDLLSSPARQGGPHRTLDQALAWSYELLDEEERQILRRLSVFSQGFELDAVEEVCGVGGRPSVELVSALLDKSLLERRAMEAEPRFHLLETTRAFAAARLDEAGEEAAIRDAHARWVAGLAQRAGQELAGGAQRTWLDKLDAEHGNLVSALAWARSGGDPELGLATAASLGRYWSARGSYREGRRELEELLDHPEAGEIAPSVRADGLVTLGLILHLLCELRVAHERLEEAQELLEELGDRTRMAEARRHQVWIALQIEPPAEVEERAREALARSEELGGAREVAVALNNLGWLEIYRGRIEPAEAWLRASLEHRRQAEDHRGEAFALINLALNRLLLGDELDGIEAWLTDARCKIEPLGDPPLRAWVACTEALFRTRAGRVEEALAIVDDRAFRPLDHAHPDGIAWTFLTEGEVRHAAGDLDAAKACLTEARDIWHSFEMAWGVMQTLRRLAALAQDQGTPEEARTLQRQAVELAQRFGFEG